MESMGFEMNPYDPFIANKMVKGKQMTIIWHVDDLKISHRDGLEITKIIKRLRKIYGDIKVKRGKQHHYLGMELDFKNDGKVQVLIIQYVDEIIKNFPEKIGTSTTSTPAAEYLFETREEKDAKLILEKQAIQFHHNVAKLLFVSTKARQDIQAACF